MKLATYHDGSRDGQLIVVSRDLATAHHATGIATRLQQVLDDWNFLSPQLEELFVSLNHGRARHAFPFEPSRCMAPLPRAGQYVDARAHVDAAAPGPLILRQGASDDFTGPTGDIAVPNDRMGIDLEAGLAVVTSELPMGVTSERALDGVRLLMLVNGVVLRQLVDTGLPAFPAAAFGPVAVTPDELGAGWKGGRVHLPVQVQWNGKRLGLCDAGEGMAFHFGQLLSHLATTRNVRAGAIVGGGAVRNADTSRGHASIADKRAAEAAAGGEPKTGFLRHGDTVRIDVKGADGQSVFGAIDQSVVTAVGTAAEAASPPVPQAVDDAAGTD